jgi:hypothetical protein
MMTTESFFIRIGEIINTEKDSWKAWTLHDVLPFVYLAMNLTFVVIGFKEEIWISIILG